MADSLSDLLVSLKADSAQFRSELSKANKSLGDLKKKSEKTTFTEMNQAIEIAKKAYSAITKVIGGTVRAIVSATKASMEAEHIERRAIAAMSLRGAVTQETVDQIKAFNFALQQNLGVDGDELLQIQGTLAAMGVRNDKLKEATKATIGLSNATGKSLTASVKLVAQAYTGHITALSKVGIHASSAADAQKKLGALFGVAAAQSGTLEARIATLTFNYGDLEETLGAAFTRSTALNGIVKAGSEAVAAFINIFGSESGQLLIDSFFRSIAGGVAATINAFIGLKKALHDLFAETKTEDGQPSIKQRLRTSAAATHDKLTGAGLPEWAANIVARKTPNPYFAGDSFKDSVSDNTDVLDAATEAATRFADSLTAIANAKLALLPPIKVGAGGGGGGSDCDGKAAAAEAKKRHKEALDAAVSFQDEIARIGESVALSGDKSELAKVQYDLLGGTLAKLVEKLKADGQPDQALLFSSLAIAAAKEKDKLAKINDEISALNDARAESYNKWNDLQSEATDIIESQKTSAQKLADALDHLKIVQAAGGLTADQYAKQVGVLKEKFTEAIEPIFDFKEATISVIDTFADNLFDAFENGLDNMGKAFTSLLKRMAAEAIKTALVKLIFGGLLGTSASGSGIYESADGFVGPPSARALGGSALAGSPYIVGERGPELFVPRTSGEIIPHGEQRSGGRASKSEVVHSLRFDRANQRMTVRDLWESMIVDDGATRR